MKDYILTVAIFVVILLFTPLLLAVTGNKVKQNTAVYASNTHMVTITRDNETNESANGSFKIKNTSTGVEQDVDAFDFICGVVAGEVPAEYNSEALKAQAVAAFSYCCYVKEHGNGGASITAGVNVAYVSKTEAQKSWGKNFDKEWDKIESAVQSVEGKALFYGNDVAEATYYAMSSGKTESCKDVWGDNVPYLVEVSSPGDTLQKDYLTHVTVSSTKFRSIINTAINGASFNKDPKKWLTDEKLSGAGGVIAANLCGKTVSGKEIRTLFGLRSTNFNLNYSKSKDKFTFDVRGYGHGVGMSQCGAQYMAQQGKNWQKILTYYYHGTTIGDYNWNSSEGKKV